jgi:hypothetical protein
MRRSKWVGPVVALAFGLLAGVPTAAAEAPAQVDSIAIQGDAVVGATLTAVAEVTGDPAPTVEYRWVRCDAGGKMCRATLVTSATYVIPEEDLGFTLRVQVAATNSLGADDERSAPTEVVTAPPAPPRPPDPEPTPAPSTGTDPPPTNTTTAGSTTIAAPAPTSAPSPAPVEFVAAPAAPIPLARPVSTPLRYLRPFPVVRIKGLGVKAGAWIELFRVVAPRGAAVAVTCRGTGCPLRRLSLRPGRIRQLERFLPVGVTITIRVTRTGYIGKYVRFVIRSHAAPKRTDSCLLPGRTRPTRCPA